MFSGVDDISFMTLLCDRKLLVVVTSRDPRWMPSNILTLRLECPAELFLIVWGITFITDAEQPPDQKGRNFVKSAKMLVQNTVDVFGSSIGTISGNCVPPCEGRAWRIQK